MSSENSIPIPQPPTHLFIGNVTDIDPSNAPGSFQRLAEIYGEIYQLDLPGREGWTIVVSSHKTINDCCDAERFEKPIDGSLKQVRNLTGDGLFTAYPGEKSWGVAHRLLMPVFGPIGIRKMFPGMMDIASQMLLKWDRLGPDNAIVCADDFTRLAFDVIGFCALGFRFNNFYSEHSHPFVDQMTEVLLEAGKRSSRLALENRIRVFSAAQLADNIAKMHALCDQIVTDRIAHPQPDAQDLLNTMIDGVDKETGEKMSKETIRHNMVTFLVAGHETTSGTLSFLFYHLLKNPEKYMKAQQEVDDALGDRALEVKDLSKFIYIKFAIYEALRFMGPIALNAKHAINPGTKILGKYAVKPNDQVLMNLYGLHHDPKVWGDDATSFRPERFLDGGWEKLPKNSWKAFGDGSRACIGRTFAEQEMIIVVALILQSFQVELEDPAYDLRVKVTLTQKPDGLKLKVRRRPGCTLANLGGAPISNGSKIDHSTSHWNAGPVAMDLKPATVLYGSNAGTCKSYAEDMASNAARYGFKANVDTLDSATESVPKDQPVIIIEPSYEGQPADNAHKFTKYLESNAKSKLMKGVKYAVFGVGNSDWAHTFHRVPKLTDELLDKMGGQRILPMGSVDVREDIMGPWEEWQDKIWAALRQQSGQSGDVKTSQLQVEITPPKFATVLGGTEIGYGHVKVNKELCGTKVGLAKNHMEIELPAGSSYRAGDYLVVLPLNGPSNVKRVLKRFDLSPDDNVSVSGTSKAYMLNDAPLSVSDLVSTRVELGTPISQRQLKALVDATPESNRSELARLATDEVYKKDILLKRRSVLDVLEDYPDCELSFAAYLDMLKPLSPRQYSISSSPMANVQFTASVQYLKASITYDVLSSPSLSDSSRPFNGVASTYLARQQPGDRLRCFTRATNADFHLPQDPTVPIIMVCAGTGVAPMRAFLQERSTIKKARNAALGPAILYFGCRHPEDDYIYRAELKQCELDGVVALRPTFSRSQEGEYRYAHERMYAEREELAQLFMAGAKIFVCGSASKLGRSVGETCMRIWRERKEGRTHDEAREWLELIKVERYVSDVYD